MREGGDPRAAYLPSPGATTTLEDRVKALEDEVAELNRRAARKKTVGEWLDRIWGRLAKYPEFAEVMRLGRELRRADRPGDEN